MILTIFSSPKDGATITQNHQIQKMCSVSPVGEIEKNMPPPISQAIGNPNPVTTQDVMDEPYWIEQPTQKEDISLTLDDDIPYTRRSIRNCRFHQPIQTIAMKAV